MAPKRDPQVTRSVRTNSGNGKTFSVYPEGQGGGPAVVATEQGGADSSCGESFIRVHSDSAVQTHFFADAEQEADAAGTATAGGGGGGGGGGEAEGPEGGKVALHSDVACLDQYHPANFIDSSKKRLVVCEICLEEGVPCSMRYQGGEQWTHRTGECAALFSSHLMEVDRRSVQVLLSEIRYCTGALETFQSCFGGDREYSVRALQEERSQAVVALHRRLRATFHVLGEDGPWKLSRTTRELILAFTAGSLRMDTTPTDPADPAEAVF